MLAARCERFGAHRPAGFSDEALWVLAARQGDETALLRLLGRFRPVLHRLVSGICGDAGLAEDLVQDSLLHALSHLDELRDPEMFYPWLRKSAVRRTLRALRGRRETIPLEGLPLSSVDPSVALDASLQVRSLLACLPSHHRAVLVLRELEELDYREIAALLGVPVGTVRSRLFAARERFRSLYLEAETEGGTVNVPR